MIVHPEIIVLTPVYKEPPVMLSSLDKKIGEIADYLKTQGGVDLKWYFAADNPEVVLPTPCSMILRNEKNSGMALTMLRAYGLALERHPNANAVVKIDANEHDPMYLLDIANCLLADTPAMLIPVRQPNTSGLALGKTTNAAMKELRQAIELQDHAGITALFDNTLLLGFQAFQGGLMRKMLPSLKEGMEIFEKISGRPSRWYIDLLTIILATHFSGGKVELMFGGYTADFEAGRSPEKRAEQLKEAQDMYTAALAVLKEKK